MIHCHCQRQLIAFLRPINTTTVRFIHTSRWYIIYYIRCNKCCDDYRSAMVKGQGDSCAGPDEVPAEEVAVGVGVDVDEGVMDEGVDAVEA